MDYARIFRWAVWILVLVLCYLMTVWSCKCCSEDVILNLPTCGLLLYSWCTVCMPLHCLSVSFIAWMSTSSKTLGYIYIYICTCLYTFDRQENRKAFCATCLVSVSVVSGGSKADALQDSYPAFPLSPCRTVLVIGGVTDFMRSVWKRLFFGGFRIL